jgi:stearoyl-CoA desaturase (Delta-9 desaturase)
LSKIAIKLIYKAAILIFVIVPLLATVLAIWLSWEHAVQWSDLVLLAVMYTFTLLGVTIGFHRMIVHRSFRPHPVLKFVLLVLGSMATQGPVLRWAAIHIKHHAKTDQEGDPHSPLQGLLFAHITWLLGDGMNQAPPQIYCRHLLKDRLVVFVNYTFFLWTGLGLLLPFLLGGWTGFLWGGLVRIFLTDHVMWSVNSICHAFGKREFGTTDQSRNEWVVGLLCFGEGWHNNHHAFPRSAFHGLHWWQFDLSGYLIWTLERFGLAKDVYRVPPALLARRALYQLEVADRETPEEPASI